MEVIPVPHRQRAKIFRNHHPIVMILSVSVCYTGAIEKGNIPENYGAKERLIMKRTHVNKELLLNYTENFCEMDAAALRKYFTTEQNRWGIYDEKRHAIISVAWTRTGLLNLLTDAKAIVKGTERCMKKNLQDYCRTEKISTVISGAKAKGIRFLYTATGTDIKQKGETLALRCGGKFYVVQFVTRAEGEAENRRMYDAVLQSIELPA